MKRVPLRRVSTILNGGTPTSDVQNWGGSVPWATPADLASVDGSSLGATDRTLTTKGVLSGSAIASAGAVLVSTRAPIGYTALVNSPTAFNQGCKAVIPGDDLHPRYLQFCLIAATPQLKASGSGSTFLELSTEALSGQSIRLPEIGDQRRIADFLDDRVSRIDKVISARRKERAVLDEFLQRQIQKLLLGDEGALVGQPPWFTSSRANVSFQSLRTLWEVIDCKHRTPEYVDAGYPVVSPGDITPGLLDLSVATRFVDEEDFKDLADPVRRCRRGDIVYSRNASAGTAAYVATDAPFTMGQDVCRITSETQDQRYLAYCLNFLTRPQLDSYRVGSTFTRINVSQIKGLVVPVRDVSVQQKLARRCDTAAQQVADAKGDLNHSISLLTEYKSSLITAAVTGELDVTTAGSNIPG